MPSSHNLIIIGPTVETVRGRSFGRVRRRWANPVTLEPPQCANYSAVWCLWESVVVPVAAVFPVAEPE